MNRIELKVNHLIKTNSADDLNGSNMNYICQYLKSLGIKDCDLLSFIDKPRESDQDMPTDLLNIEEACRVAFTALQQGVKPFIVVDSDCDGYTSSSILINYLRRRFPSAQIGFALHPGKEHGIVLADIPDEYGLIFVPDAGSNNYEEQKALIAQGKKVIVLDHHDVDHYEDTGAILVNNQFSPRFSNKFLSGAGIVYMFIKQMDAMFFPSNPIHRDYLDLAAIGIIADAMNMTTLGNNYIAYYGLAQIHSPFIRAVAVKQSRGIKNPDRLTKIDVAFYIAPVINGVIRSGTTEDKETVFKAMSNENSDETFETVWRGVTRNENLYEYAARLAANAKSRQDSNKRKSFEWLCSKIKAEGKDKDNLIIVTLDEAESKNVSPTITGLIAMELVKEFNRPALVLRKTQFEGRDVYGGSGRNGNFYGLNDLKAFLQRNNAFYAEGHPNAFGAFLLPDQVDKIREAANTQLNASSFEIVYEVDYMFKDKYDIDFEMLYQMACHDDLWGNSLPQPRFSFTIDYDKTDVIIMGKDRSSVKIKCGQLSFVAFKSVALAEKLMATPYGTATIVGRPQLNDWQGNTTLQVVIDDIDIVEREPQPRVHSVLDLI